LLTAPRGGPMASLRPSAYPTDLLHNITYHAHSTAITNRASQRSRHSSTITQTDRHGAKERTPAQMPQPELPVGCAAARRLATLMPTRHGNVRAAPKHSRLDHVAFVRHVDAVEEFTDVLPLDCTDLLDERTRAANVVDVVADEHNLVLDIAGARNGDALTAVDNAHHLRVVSRAYGLPAALPSLTSTWVRHTWAQRASDPTRILVCYIARYLEGTSSHAELQQAERHTHTASCRAHHT
jgi:hypothetical protein